MLPPGCAAPEVSLPDLDGVAWSLREALQLGPVVLVFFKISCPTCQLTLPFLQRLADSPNGSPRLFGISQDDVPDTREFQQRFGLSMPTLIDAPHDKGPRRYPASDAYRITSVPSIFVVETDGKIASAVEGFNKAELEKLGQRFHVAAFRETDRVPALRPG